MDIDSIILFLGLAAVTIWIWQIIAHIDTYFGLKKDLIKDDNLDGFNFFTFTLHVVKKKFTGKGIF